MPIESVQVGIEWEALYKTAAINGKLHFTINRLKMVAPKHLLSIRGFNNEYKKEKTDRVLMRMQKYCGLLIRM